MKALLDGKCLLDASQRRRHKVAGIYIHTHVHMLYYVQRCEPTQGTRRRRSPFTSKDLFGREVRSHDGAILTSEVVQHGPQRFTSAHPPAAQCAVRCQTSRATRWKSVCTCARRGCDGEFACGRRGGSRFGGMQRTAMGGNDGCEYLGLGWVG